MRQNTPIHSFIVQDVTREGVYILYREVLVKNSCIAVLLY